MTENDYECVGYLHDARINLNNAISNLDNRPWSLSVALKIVEHELHEPRFYVSVSTDEAWIGSDGMYVDFSTFDGRVGGGERLSHHIRPLPDTLDDFITVLAGIVEGLPHQPSEE